jgi:polyisoprenoid-binding protein YceI
VPSRIRLRHWKRWLVIAVVVVAAAVVGGPFVYIHFIEGQAPPPLSLRTPSPASSTQGATNASQTSAASDGAWNVTTGSVVGYRVEEILFGQSNTAVGRTSSITGSMTVNEMTVTNATFTVDMTTVTSDQTRRDGQFNGRIMDTASHPTATFTLTQPIKLGSIPGAGVVRTFHATGNLTLHGVTKAVSFTLTGRYTGSTVQIAGSLPITFADWNIPNPSFGPVTTQDHGVLEFAINFAHA